MNIDRLQTIRHDVDSNANVMLGDMEAMVSDPKERE